MGLGWGGFYYYFLKISFNLHVENEIFFGVSSLSFGKRIVSWNHHHSTDTEQFRGVGEAGLIISSLVSRSGCPRSHGPP